MGNLEFLYNCKKLVRQATGEFQKRTLLLIMLLEAGVLADHLTGQGLLEQEDAGLEGQEGNEGCSDARKQERPA